MKFSDFLRLRRRAPIYSPYNKPVDGSAELVDRLRRMREADEANGTTLLVDHCTGRLLAVIAESQARQAQLIAEHGTAEL